MTVFLEWLSRSLNFIFDIIYLTKHQTNDDDDSHITAILKKRSILQKHYIYNVLSGHCKVPAMF